MKQLNKTLKIKVKAQPNCLKQRLLKNQSKNKKNRKNK